MQINNIANNGLIIATNEEIDEIPVDGEILETTQSTTTNNSAKPTTDSANYEVQSDGTEKPQSNHKTFLGGIFKKIGGIFQGLGKLFGLNKSKTKTEETEEPVRSVKSSPAAEVTETTEADRKTRPPITDKKPIEPYVPEESKDPAIYQSPEAVNLEKKVK
jgi:hypothetical protein